MARIRKPPACTDCGWSIQDVKCTQVTASQKKHWPTATRHCTGFKDQPTAIDAILLLRTNLVTAHVIRYDNKTKDIMTCTTLQHVLRHSPDGFEYGYGGSGPSDLALSIATEIFGRDAADGIYQQLRDKFVAPLKMDVKRHLILRKDIIEWHRTLPKD